MVAGLLGMILANAAALLAAHALWRRVRTPNPEANAVLFLLLHVMVLSVAVLAAGLLAGLTALRLSIGAFVLLAVLIALGEQRHVKRPRWPDMGRATAGFVGLLALRALLQVWFFAPHGGDVLAYHLPKVAEWIQAGRFTGEMGLDLCAPFPAGFELLETWWVVFLRHDVVIEMAGVEFALLGFAAVRLLASQAGLDARASSLAAALYVASPVYSMQITTCYNDAPTASLVLALGALVMARAHPLLLLLPLALGVGVKGTLLYTLPGWLLLAWARRRLPVLRPGSVSWAGGLAACAVAVGSFWYLRNLAWFGNPTFPVTGHGFDWGTAHVQAGPRLSSLATNLSRLVSGFIADNQSAPQPLAIRSAGWGVLAFGAGAVALIQDLREDAGLRALAAAFLVGLLCVLLMVYPDDWCLRFVLFFPALLFIAAARLASRSRLAAVLIAAAAAVQFATTCVPQELDPAQMSALVAQPWRERSAGPLVGYAGVPPGEPVATTATTRVPEYIVYGPGFDHRVLHLRVDDVGAMKEQMVAHRVRYVYLELTSPRRIGEVRILTKIGELTPLSERLYRLE
jgi:hypothetical protein